MNILIPAPESFLRRADAVHSPRVARPRATAVLADGRVAVTAEGRPALKWAQATAMPPRTRMRAEDVELFSAVLQLWAHAARRRDELGGAAERGGAPGHLRAIRSEVAGLEFKAERFTQALLDRFRNQPGWRLYIRQCSNVCARRQPAAPVDAFLARR